MIPGLLLSIITGAIAYIISNFIPLDSVTLAILLGIIISNIRRPSATFTLGLKFSEKTMLSISIALMGVKLNYTQFKGIGIPLFVMIISGICFTILLSILIGKLFKIDSELALLVGIGNAVCGSSAIAASQGVIQADEEKVGISIATINFLGTVGIFLLPTIIKLCPNISEFRGGLLIGNTLQAIGQVTAAGFSVSEATGQVATLIKMGRILMIMPVVITLGLLKRTKSNKKKSSIPPYIIWFIGFSILTSLNIIPSFILPILKNISKFFLITAMASIGMKISFATLKGEGKKALCLGLFIFTCQILFSIILTYKY